MSMPTVQQLEGARAELTKRWQHAVVAGATCTEHEAVESCVYHHVDVLWRAMEELDELIRDERRAMELDKQRAIAPASSQQGSQRQPVKFGNVRRRQ